MKTIVIMLVMIGFAVNANSQVATIQDEDGYTNVRQKPNGKAKIIHKINEGEVFFIGEDTDGWVEVHFSSDMFSEDIIRKGLRSGYVHNSRILPLEAMSQYAGDDCTFQYVITPFTKEGKTFQFEGNDKKYLDRINEDYFWGTDGGWPKTEVKELNISVKGKKIEVPDNLLADIYEINDDFECYKVAENFIVHQFNSDGAGGYELVWVFDENGLVQRLVGDLY